MKKTKQQYFPFDFDNPNSEDEFDMIKDVEVQLPKYTYNEILQLLDRLVIGQSEAKHALSFAAHLYLHTSQPTPNGLPKLLLCGPTGSGKSMLAKSLAMIMGAPFLTIDSTQLTAYGYRGVTIASLFYEHFRALCEIYQLKTAQKMFEKTVVIIDEFDKLAGYAHHPTQTSWRQGLQQELLMLFQEPRITYSLNDENTKSVTFDPRGMLFILAGAFTGLNSIRPRAKRAAGFCSTTPMTQKSSALFHEQLVNYGISRELIGRIGDIVFIDKLTSEEMKSILSNSMASPFEYYRTVLHQTEGKELVISDDVIDAIAEIVPTFETGARGLFYLIYQVIKEAYRYNRMSTVVQVDLSTLQRVMSTQSKNIS